MNKKVPKGWKIGKFSDLVKVTNGYAFQSSDFVEKTSTSLPVIKMNCLKKGHIDLSNAAYVKRETVKELGKFLLTRGDFVFGMSGSISNFAVIKKKDGACYQNQRVGRLSPLNSSSEFVSQLFISESVTQQIKSLAAGGAQVNISSNQIENVEILNPPIEEQKKIGSILTSVDDVIETTQKKIDKLQDLKKATMNELLTKGIGHIEFKDSKLGRIPKSWEVRKVGEFAEVTKLAGFEYTDHFDYSVGGEIIAIRALNLTNGKLDLRNVQTIPREVSDKLPRSKLYSGDILITYVGVNIGELGFIDQDNKYHLAPNVAKISFDKEEIDSNFMFQQMIYERTQRNIKKLTGVTSQPSLNMSNIREILVCVPEIHEQKRICKIFKNFDEQIYGIKGKIFSLTCLKKSLMQDLLTGKVRV